MTVCDVRGTGNSPESTDWFGGDESLVAFPIRSKLMVVAPDDLAEEIVQAIVENAQSGESGDGKIFLERVSEALRIRTEERGELAI
jgi:nitrogen regulatory protein P-II 1